MPPRKLPQREMLRRLLDSGKLATSDAKAVRKLHDDLAAGRIGGLNGQQAAWAEELCRKCGFVAAPVRPHKKRTTDEAKRMVAEFDAMPRPKKPPGRG
jgi:hypothetical protein